jgi:hypothetical protein
VRPRSFHAAFPGPPGGRGPLLCHVRAAGRPWPMRREIRNRHNKAETEHRGAIFGTAVYLNYLCYKALSCYVVYVLTNASDLRRCRRPDSGNCGLQAPATPSLVPGTRHICCNGQAGPGGGSSAGQSSGLIIRRSWVRAPPAPRGPSVLSQVGGQPARVAGLTDIAEYPTNQWPVMITCPYPLCAARVALSSPVL